MIKNEIENLDTLLQIKAKDSHAHHLKKFNEIEGVSDRELKHIENELDIRLPAELKEFYKEKNGTGYHFHVLIVELENGHRESLYLYSIDEIVENKPLFGYNQFIQKDDVESLSNHDERIRPCFSNEHWVPIAQVGGGSTFLLLDYDPSEEGKEGQIILYSHAPDRVYYIGDSFKELLRKSNEYLAEMHELDN